MPTRISKKLSELKRQGKKALAVFITAGDPNLATTEKLIHTLSTSGVSLIELGIPFSDPMADGTVIQRANERALKRRTNLPNILNLARKVRKSSQIPILLMGYYNPIFNYGLEKFAGHSARAGVDGVLVVDLPVEESGPLKKALKKYSLDLVCLATPTSTPKRLAQINRHGTGFVYYVNFTGVTGAGNLNPRQVITHLTKLKETIKKPILAGFGISKPSQIKKIMPYCDGIVVGSAFMKIIEKRGNSTTLATQIHQYTKRLLTPLQSR